MKKVIKSVVSMVLVFVMVFGVFTHILWLMNIPK